MLEQVAERAVQLGRARPALLGNTVLVVLVLIALAAEVLEGDMTVGPLALLVVGLGVFTLTLRRSHPVLVMVVAIAGRLFVNWSTGSGLAMLPITAVALYTVARHGDRRAGVLTACGGATAMALINAGFGDDPYLVELLEEGAQSFLPIAIGDAVRTREDRVRDLIEAEAEARVQAERLRIARDLHDVVAHGLSTIAIQSGVAARLVDRDTNQAKEALEVINETGRSSLAELRSMVGALRSTDTADVRPTPADPNDLSDVVAGAERAGVRVRIQQEGAFPGGTRDAVIVAVHRIIQEATMNVARHAGPVDAMLTLGHGVEGVQVSIRNEAGRGAAPVLDSTGVGIVGMKERSESVGGLLEAGPTEDGGFLVSASIPYGRSHA